MTYYAYYQSEIGLIEICGTAQAIRAARFVETAHQPQTLSPPLSTCLVQLEEYFQGERRTFSLPLEPEGTPFQKAVWQETAQIPYGQTASYGDIARRLNNEKAIRAIGRANGQNKIVIIIPCHRIIGSDGSLTGYGGGLWRKKWLLEHEQASGQLRLWQ